MSDSDAYNDDRDEYAVDRDGHDVGDMETGPAERGKWISALVALL
mgnify:CR=1 FL=1